LRLSYPCSGALRSPTRRSTTPEHTDPGLAELPTGTVTFLFTDIEGSTRLERELREEYGQVLAKHRRVARVVFGRYSGHEIDTQGDSFFVVFPRARDAVAAAVELQRDLAAHTWPEGKQVRVRIGMHTGEASLHDGHYVGLAVHRAARIAAAAHGGQILLSRSTRDVVEDDLPSDQRLRDLGEQRLKDLPRPEHLFQLDADGLAVAFPPLRTSERGRSRRRRTILVAGGLVAAGLVGAATLLASRDDAAAAPPVVPNSLVKIDAGSNEIVDVVRVGRDPGQIAVVGGYLFVASERDGALHRVDLASSEVVASGRHEATGGVAAEGDDLVWVTSTTRGEVSRVQAESLAALDRVEIPADLVHAFVAVGGGSLWVSEYYPPRVVEFGLRSLAVKRTYPLDAGETPVEVTFAEGAAWVGLGSGALLRIDARSGETSVTPVTDGTGDPTSGFGSMWVASFGVTPGVATRVDPFTERAQDVIEVGNVPWGITAGDGSVWVANYCDGTVSRIDAATNAVTATIEVGYFPKWTAFARGHVWVGLAATDTKHFC
jgi:YVTN family beta-propeller protein